MWKDLRKEVRDVIKGCASVIIVTVVMSILQYIGTHIPDIVHLFTQFLSAVVGVKIARK